MIPKDYVCGGCGATRVKLWREYQTAAKYSKLLCGACAEEDQRKELDLTQSDAIGWMVPAVPTLDPEAPWWGYSSVPAMGAAWWKALPLKLNGEWEDRDGVKRWVTMQEFYGARPFVPCIDLHDGRALVCIPHKGRTAAPGATDE